MTHSPRHNVGSVAEPHWVVDEEHYLKAVADADHFFWMSGKYLERANEAEAQRDKAREDAPEKHIKEVRLEAHNAALERAATLCENYPTDIHTNIDAMVANDCATLIRAMKVEK